jgi:hypothetical protein
MRDRAEAWANCVIPKIQALDDSVSDASTIGVAVRSSCHNLYYGSPNGELPIIVEAILKVRAQRSANRRSPANTPSPPPMMAPSPPPMIPAKTS